MHLTLRLINSLNLQFIQEAAQTCGHAAVVEEETKHSRSDETCAHGLASLWFWKCSGDGAMMPSIYLNSVQKRSRPDDPDERCRPLNKVVSTIYGCLSLTIMKQNARAI